MAVITLLSDFGTRDAYVGVMKGVILSINPDARIIDLTHDVGPQDIVEAAWLLRTSYTYFPQDAVHIAVVDPGVGTERRAIAARAGAQFFVGPDNGVLSWALDAAGGAEIVEVTNRAYMLPDISATFHGRDVFAPVAAHLTAGVPLEALGEQIDDIVRLPLAEPAIVDDHIECQVVHVDRFGNLITTLDRTRFEAWVRTSNVTVEVAGRRIDGIARTYGDSAPGGVIALFGSSGYLEIAVREGSAASTFGVGRGATIMVRRA